MSNHPYSPQQPLFKAYDIRGDRKLFTDKFVQALSQVFAEQLIAHGASRVVLGYDVRHGSEAIARQFAQTLNNYGLNIIWLGLVTTPMMAFWAQQFEGHGIIATASHSECHISGIKWLIAGESPSSEDIQALYQQLAHTRSPATVASDAAQHIDSFTTPQYPISCETLPNYLIGENYFNGIADALNQIQQGQRQSTGLALESRPLTVVVDCLNGATSPFAQKFFAQFDTLCAHVITLNNTPDGNFPKGNPDPTETGRLKELQQAVITHRADVGFGFDGDGDRLMVVDNLGHILEPDHLLYLLAKIAIVDSKASQNQPSVTTNIAATTPTVIFDVKCSHHLPTLIQGIGGQPQMSKTGSSTMRKALQSGGSNAIFAGELSGHFLFNDGYFVLHDDAMYAALRLLNWLSTQSDSLADLIARLPQMVNTPDVYLPLKRFDYISTQGSLLQKLSELCNKLQSCCPSDFQQTLYRHGRAAKLTSGKQLGLPDNTRLTCIDGIRLDFANGFGVIRPSNTSHSITVRFAGNTLADLRAIQERFVELCKNIDEDLASQIAKIRPSG
ncbi:phosphomannomutase/phosphoglucomutase [Psychrobacter pygoscelis]|uniref:phosphomannomutase/phosphoglucomutase n=1 Tax=Psychrobacter pygoscelis TaxID=2488563 RepID=UPI00103A5026|nr:phosphomannomutase/phosphoglucomutase [Psychrobacter pygoscelis]